MKKRKKAPIIIVIVIAAFAAFGFNRYLKNVREKAERDAKSAIVVDAPPVKKDTIKVLFAKSDIPVGELIDPGKLEVKEFPKDLLTKPGYFMGEQQGELENMVARVNIIEGDMIVKEKIAAPKDATRLSMNIPTGFRAMTIPVDKVKSVAGFIRHGDFVDVIGSVKVGPKTVTKAILQNVQVLAIDHSFHSEEPIQKNKEGERKVVINFDPKLITLGVPLWAVERLLALERMGGLESLRLVLKSNADSPRLDPEGKRIEGTQDATEGIAGVELFEMDAPVQIPSIIVKVGEQVPGSEKAVPAPKSPVLSTLGKATVRIHRAGRSSEVSFSE